MELTKTDEGCTLKKSEHCYAVWKKKRRCENCISQEVLRTHKPQTKIETRASDIYYVLASFIEVDGRPYSLELVKRIKSDDMFERENVLNQLLVRDDARRDQKIAQTHVRHIHPPPSAICRCMLRSCISGKMRYCYKLFSKNCQ